MYKQAFPLMDQQFAADNLVDEIPLLFHAVGKLADQSLDYSGGIGGVLESLHILSLVAEFLLSLKRW